jgi:hypothetical protein
MSISNYHAESQFKHWLHWLHWFQWLHRIPCCNEIFRYNLISSFYLLRHSILSLHFKFILCCHAFLSLSQLYLRYHISAFKVLLILYIFNFFNAFNSISFSLLLVSMKVLMSFKDLIIDKEKYYNKLKHKSSFQHLN